MAILDQGHSLWIVLVVSLCGVGCERSQSGGMAIETNHDAGNTSAATTSTEPSAASSSGRSDTSSAAAGGGRPGTITSRAPVTSDAGALVSMTPATASAGSPALSAGASGSSTASAGASGSVSSSQGSAAGASATTTGDAGKCDVRNGTAATPGFVGDWNPGTYPDDFTSASDGKYLKLSGVENQGGMDREYAVHVPLGYDKSTALPALFCLHAFSMNARSFCLDMAGWPAKADKEKFIVIMPNGYQNSWNIGEDCGAGLLPVHTEGIDDVGFVRALLAEVGKHVNIDLGRVYATGFSNGSSLAWRLACDASDIFTAVVPVAAGSCLAMCKPSHKVSLLDVYGAADSFNPTEDLASSMAAIRSVSGCSMTTMPAAVPMTTGTANCLTSMGCSSGECSSIEVTQCIVQNGSHCWYGDISTADCGAGDADNEFFMTNLAWDFLKRLSR